MKKLIVCLIAAAVFAISGKAHAQKKAPVLNHVAIYVVDLKKSTAFYQNIVQIDTVPEPFHDGKHTWFKVGEYSTLHIIEGAKEAVVHDKSHHMCFSVPSLEDFMARLEKEKIFYTNLKGDGKTPNVRVDGVKQIYLKDPDGYWLEINNEKY
ncbi:MAG TPA: VOC family protein [Flavitalea sp.]|nr:VOC family protein [Flavitalea sp.]